MNIENPRTPKKCQISNQHIDPSPNVCRQLFPESNGASSLDMSFGASRYMKLPAPTETHSSNMWSQDIASISKDNVSDVQQQTDNTCRDSFVSQSDEPLAALNPSSSIHAICPLHTLPRATDPRKKTETTVLKQSLVMTILRFLLSALEIFQHALSETGREVETTLQELQSASEMEDLSLKSPSQTLHSMLNTTEDSVPYVISSGACPASGQPEFPVLPSGFIGSTAAPEAAKVARPLLRRTPTLYGHVTANPPTINGFVDMLESP